MQTMARLHSLPVESWPPKANALCTLLLLDCLITGHAAGCFSAWLALPDQGDRS